MTRQAVSRWENGDTVPNTDTLRLLSKEFDVSINTLLGEPRKLICQCCGMPIDDDSILGRDKDGTLNEEYCKWCYADGTYTYNDMDELIDVCVKNMVNENFTEEQARSYLKEMLPKLDYWKRYDELSDNGQFEELKKQLINEINDLHIDGLPRVDKLNALVGKYVNLEYQLPNGQKVSFWMIRKLIWEIKWSLNSEETGVLAFWQIWILFWYVHMRRLVKIRNY